MAKVVGFTIEIKGQKQIIDSTKALGLLNTQLILINNSLKEINKNAGQGLSKLSKDFGSTADSAKKLGVAAKSSFQTFEQGTKIVQELGNGYFEVTEEIENTSKSIADLKEENKDLKQFLEEAPQEGTEAYKELAKSFGEGEEGLEILGQVLDESRQQFTENREAILGFNKELRTGQKESEIAEGSILDLRNQVKELTKQYTALGKEAREGTEGKEIQENLKNTVKELKTLEEAVGDNRRSVGDYQKAFQGFGGILAPVKAGLNGVNSAFKLLVANPILAILTAIVGAFTGLVAAFRSTKEGAEFFDRATAAVSATLDVLRDVAVRVGGALVSVFKDPIGSLTAFAKAIKDSLLNVLGGVVNLVTALGSGIKSLVTLDLEGLKKASADAAQVLENGFNTATGAAKVLTDAIGATADEIARESAEAAKLTGILQNLTDVQRTLSVQRANLNAQLAETRAISRDTNRSLEERIGALKQVRQAEGEQLALELDAQQKRVNALKALASQSDSSKEALDEIAQAEIALARIRQQSASSEISIQRELDRLTNQRRKEQEKAKKQEEKDREDARKAREKLLDEIENENLARLKLINKFNSELQELEIESIESLTEAAIAAENLRFTRQEEARKKNLAEVEAEAIAQRKKVIEQFDKGSKEREEFEKKTAAQLEQIRALNRKITEENEKEHQENLDQIQEDGITRRQKAITGGFAKIREALKKGNEAIAEQSKETATKSIEDRKKELEAFLDTAQQISDTVFTAISQFTEIANEAETERLDTAIESRQESIANLNAELANATGLQKKFLEQQVENEKKALIEEEKAREEAERKRVKQAQALALVQAIINGAIAITRAFSDLGPIGGAIAAIGVAAALAAQIATISSQKFADGGVISGPSHANGGVPVSVGGRGMVEAEGGEAIINRRSTSMFKPLLSAINQAGGGVKFQDGGILSSPISAPIVSSSPLSSDLTQVLTVIDRKTDAIDNRITNLTVTQDLNNLQDIQDNDNDLNVLTTLN
jgi:hypothetical protein